MADMLQVGYDLFDILFRGITSQCNFHLICRVQ